MMSFLHLSLRYSAFLLTLLGGQFVYAQDFSAERPLHHSVANDLLDVTSGDIDGDGDIDLAFGTEKHLGVFINDGTGSFSEAQILTVVGEAHEIEILDIDGDGDMDISWANWSPVGAQWMENTGSGVFGSPQDIFGNSTQITSSGIDWADIDQDGDMDLFATGWIFNSLRWVENDGSQNFTSNGLVVGCTKARHCVAADLDNDGDIDGAVAGDEVHWRDNQNNVFTGPLPPNGTLVGEIEQASGIVAHDIMNDGYPDLIVADRDGDQIIRYNNVGNGVFNSQVINNIAVEVEDIDLFDINLDGDMDLLSACAGNSTIMVNYNCSGISGIVLVDDAHGAVAITAADLDNNGLPDLIVGNGDADAISVHFQVSLGNFSNGVFLSPEAGSIISLLLEDLDGDGMDDAILYFAGSNRLVWQRSLGNNEFSPLLSIDDDALALTVIRAVDLDSDGDMDLVGSDYSVGIVWYRNNGNGGFTPALPISVTPTRFFDIGDLDNDGDPDIMGYTQSGGDFSWYPNSGNGNFNPPSLVFDLNNVTDFILFDPDMDNDMDMAAAGNNHDFVYIENTGNLVYPSADSIAFPGFTEKLMHWDLNDDQKEDIVLINYSGMMWMEGNGDGTFQPMDTAMFDYDQLFTDLQIVDIDSDGDPDAVTSSYQDGKVSWFANDGNASFTLGGVLDSTYIIGRDVAVGDIDNDGDPDVAAGSSSTDKTSWYENFLNSPYYLDGHVYYDVDSSLSYNSGDIEFPYQALNCAPLVSVPFTNTQGFYRFHADSGSYTISAPSQEPQWTNTNPSSHSVILTNSNPVASGLDLGFVAAFDTVALEVAAIASSIRCATSYNRWIDVLNMGTLTTNTQIDYFLTPDESVISFNPPPDMIIGDHFQWSIPAFTPLDDIHISMEVETSAGLWSNVADSLVVTGTTLDFTAIHTHTQHRPVLCAYDPNDKQVDPAGYGQFGAIPISTDELTYTVRFQNTGNDTAFTVMIRDMLDISLDPASVQAIGSSHTLTSITVEAERELVFLFNDILLPDSTTDQLNSNGYVVFSVNPIPGLPNETELTNSVEIYFDDNPPVFTNTVRNIMVDCNQYQVGIADLGGILEATPGDAYQWFLNETPIPGANDQTHVPTNIGSYTVLVTNAYGCDLMGGPFQVITVNILGSSNLVLAVIPNPFSSNSRIVFSDKPDEHDQLVIVNLYGREVGSFNLAGKKEIRLNGSHYFPGMYVARFERKGQMIGSTKFIVY